MGEWRGKETMAKARSRVPRKAAPLARLGTDRLASTARLHIQLQSY